jgi:hypothetical protein
LRELLLARVLVLRLADDVRFVADVAFDRAFVFVFALEREAADLVFDFVFVFDREEADFALVFVLDVAFDVALDFVFAFDLAFDFVFDRDEALFDFDFDLDFDFEPAFDLDFDVDFDELFFEALFVLLFDLLFALLFERDFDFADDVLRERDGRRCDDPPLSESPSPPPSPSPSSSEPISFFATPTAAGIATPSAVPATTFCVVERPSSSSFDMLTSRAPASRRRASGYFASLNASMNFGMIRSRRISGPCVATYLPAASAASSARGRSTSEAASQLVAAAVEMRPEPPFFRDFELPFELSRPSERSWSS